MIRPLGQVTDDLEVILEEMCFSHELQHGEILNIVRGWLEIHAPYNKEEYEAGGNPIFYYGQQKD